MGGCGCLFIGLMCLLLFFVFAGIDNINPFVAFILISISTSLLALYFLSPRFSHMINISGMPDQTKIRHYRSTEERIFAKREKEGHPETYCGGQEKYGEHLFGEEYTVESGLIYRRCSKCGFTCLVGRTLTGDEKIGTHVYHHYDDK